MHYQDDDSQLLVEFSSGFPVVRIKRDDGKAKGKA